MRFFILLLVVVSIPQLALGKKVKYRKDQEVRFDGASVDGVARTPDGAYLHQKRGVDFIPLYKIKKKFDDEISESVEFLRWEQ